MWDLDKIFDSITAPEGTNSLSAKEINYALVHRNDINVVKMIDPTADGPWIAGGACLKWFDNSPIGDADIDIFCANKNQASILIDKLHSKLQQVYKTENATTFREYKGSKTWNIQVITKNYYSSLEEVVNSFDITVCEIGTDGDRWILGNQFAKDFHSKTLRMKYPLQDSSVKRLLKYWVYGYRPVDGLIEDIINNPQSRWKFNPEEDYS